MALGATLQHLSGSLAQGLDGRGITSHPQSQSTRFTTSSNKNWVCIDGKCKENKTRHGGLQGGFVHGEFFFLCALSALGAGQGLKALAETALLAEDVP